MSENKDVKEKVKSKKQSLAPLPHPQHFQHHHAGHSAHHAGHSAHHAGQTGRSAQSGNSGQRLGARNSLRDLLDSRDEGLSKLDCGSVLPPIPTPCPPLVQSKSLAHGLNTPYLHQDMENLNEGLNAALKYDKPDKDNTQEQKDYSARLCQKGWQPDVPRQPSGWESLKEVLNTQHKEQASLFACHKIVETTGGITYDLLTESAQTTKSHQTRHSKSKRLRTQNRNWWLWNQQEESDETGGTLHKPVNAGANALARSRRDGRWAQLGEKTHSVLREVALEKSVQKMSKAEKNRQRLREKKMARIQRNSLKRKSMLQAKRMVTEGSSVPILPSVGPDNHMTAFSAGQTPQIHQTRADSMTSPEYMDSSGISPPC